MTTTALAGTAAAGSAHGLHTGTASTATDLAGSDIGLGAVSAGSPDASIASTSAAGSTTASASTHSGTASGGLFDDSAFGGVGPADVATVVVDGAEAEHGNAAPDAASTGDPVLPLAYTPEPRATYVAPPPQQVADDGEDELPPRGGSRKLFAAAILTALVGVSVLVLILLGRWNRDTYTLTCEADQIVAEQGRSFPPWGTSSLDGPAWKPITLPRSEDCAPAAPSSLAELSQLYLQKLKLRADALLSAQPVTQFEDANALIEQALLHARGPARKADRDELERLIGDIGYWRAAAKLREASAALTDAAKQFEAAALKRPKHVVDASVWDTFVRGVVEQLASGPGGATPARATTSSTSETSERPRVPEGVALPVEPVPPEPGRSAPPAAPPDAGVAPTGGVLL